jgi:hypothetical protein
VSAFLGAGQLIFGRTSAPGRRLALIPGVIALLLVGHAIDDAGIRAAVPYVAVAILSASYAIYPTIVAWAVLFAAFAGYGVAVAGFGGNGPRNEWFLFLLLGFGPAALLWVARPTIIFGRQRGVSRESHEA